MVIEGDHEITLTTEKSQFFSEWVFDSRPLDFNRFKNGKFNISQSFFGFKVKFLEKKINPDVYQMMDFRVSQSTLPNLFTFCLTVKIVHWSNLLGLEKNY